jgi:hypothetical protein
MYRTYYGDSIKLLYHKFIRPLLGRLSNGEDETTMSDGIKRFFNADTRSVYFARALRQFEIPGKEWLGGHPRTLGYSGENRIVPEQTGLVIRFDEVLPDIIELEFEERIYMMNEEQWKRIKEYVELVA